VRPARQPPYFATDFPISLAARVQDARQNTRNAFAQPAKAHYLESEYGVRSGFLQPLSQFIRGMCRNATADVIVQLGKMDFAIPVWQCDFGTQHPRESHKDGRQKIGTL
jgi:hypothetical protein